MSTEAGNVQLGFVYQEWHLLPQSASSQSATVPETDEDDTCEKRAPEPPAIQRVGPTVKSAIFQARVSRRWTLQDLAERVSAPVDDLRRYEQGQAFPPADVIKKLQMALGVRLLPK